MQWFTLALFLAGVDYALGSHAHFHAHARAHLKPDDVLAKRDIALEQIPIEEVVEVITLTSTIFANCAPTRPIDDTTVFEAGIPRPTQNTRGIEMNVPWGAEEPTTTVHLTTTVTGAVISKQLTLTVVGDVTAPSGTLINPEVEERPAPEKPAPKKEGPGKPAPEKPAPENPETAKPAKPVPEKPAPAKSPPEPTKPQSPQLLPGLPDLPQLLPGTAIPDLPHLNQVLNPSDPNLPQDLQWTKTPDQPSTKGFGGRTEPHGTHDTYHGNTGKPWGSNIIGISPAAAHNYKYVVQFRGPSTDPWTVTIWNKIGPDGKLDGWYGHSALTFVLAPGETRYVAFDEDSEGAWGAAPGTGGLPTDQWGGYTSTWGEFTFGDGENNDWSGWDVSAIQAQIAGQRVHGMRICQADGKGCSTITPHAKEVVDAYTEDKRHHDGIGGAAAPGPVRLVVDIDYQG